MGWRVRNGMVLAGKVTLQDVIELLCIAHGAQGQIRLAASNRVDRDVTCAENLVEDPEFFTNKINVLVMDTKLFLEKYPSMAWDFRLVREIADA